MTAAAAAFIAMMAFLKIVRTELDALDVLFWRGVVAAPLSLLMCWRVSLRVKRPGLVLVRAAWGTATVFLLAYSAKGLAVADMTLLFRLQPILVALMAPLLLGHNERAGRTIWLLLVLSMAGVSLILAPSLAVGSRYGIAALAAGACSAAAHVTVRALMRTDDPRPVVFYFQIVTVLVGAALLYLVAGRLPAVPSMDILGPMIGIGVTTTAGQLLMTFAYRADRAAVVAAASYVGVLFGVLVDVLYFALFPGINIWLGGALIVVAGIWLVFANNEPEMPAGDSAATSSDPAPR